VEDSVPQVAPLFWSFRLMVGIGVVLLGLFAAAFLQLCRGRLVQSPRLLKALFWSIPLPWIAIEAGWFVAEFGRQPWTISEVLPVSASVSLLQPGQIWFSLISISLIYTSLLVVELFLLRHVIRKGPASLQTGRYQGEVLASGSAL
jgi:cytochrome bd ubiquinol oxidase subunit I